MNADQPSSSDLLQGRYSQRSIISATCDISLSIAGAKPFSKRTGSEEASSPTTSSGYSPDADDGRQLDGLAEAASSQALGSNSNQTRRPIAVISADRSRVEESYDEAGSNSASPDSRARRNCTLEDDNSSTDRSACQFSQQTGDHSLPLAALDTLMDQSDLCEVVSPIFGHTATEQWADQNCADELQTGVEADLSMTERQSTTLGTPSENTAFTSPGPSICDTINEVVFPPGTCETERLKLQHWADVAHETENRAPHPILKHWLHPIRYASLHPIADTEEVVDTDTTMYDVLAIPWDVFKLRAGKGEVFRTPLLIKETFADADEFSVEDYADRLEQTFVGMEVIVRYHMSAPEPLPVSEAARLVRTPHDTVLPNAPNFLDLETLSDAIKPGLTRLPRYRLLDTLVRGAKANYAGRPGKKTYLTPFDVGSCQSFEILGLRGAFSGAHMDALGGTWLRNLFGTKLWMVIPERLMTDQDWVDFSKAGSSWRPGTKSRALILGPGDVFFMPPGTRIIHAVLTLETCLMDGGMLWDDLTLLPLLQTIHWIGSNQNATNEALPFQIGDVLNQLERVLGSKMGIPRFGDTAGLFEVIRDLRSLGCECELCDETCPCSREDRRCTPLCNDHLMGTERECFEEPRSEDSDDAGSLYEGDD
jgi:hypothetical protein